MIDGSLPYAFRRRVAELRGDVPASPRPTRRQVSSITRDERERRNRARSIANASRRKNRRG